MKPGDKKIIVVGGGMAGLTATAYLAKEGYETILIEKNKHCGGLLTSFDRDGFVFDSGARSILNSGMIRPMLAQLGIDLELFDSPVTIGFEDNILDITSIKSIDDFAGILHKLYPDSGKEVDRIINATRKIMKDMAVLYGVDNPIFKDLKNDKEYLFKTLLPWLPKFYGAISRINKTQEPIESFLEKIASDRSLIDIISQHFFKGTPTSFALGYFYVYLDYIYPKGGTGQLSSSIRSRINELGGKINTETQIVSVIPAEKKVRDSEGNEYFYDHLIWCADMKALYKSLDTTGLKKKDIRRIEEKGSEILSKHGGESVFTSFLAVDIPPEKFRAISNGHFFYTPSRKGLGETHRSELKALLDDFNNRSKKEIIDWVKKYIELNTYEISIPSLRDPALSPEGKTGLIISILFDYELEVKIAAAGWRDEFREIAKEEVIEVLTRTIYPGLKDNIIFSMSSTPITIQRGSGSSEGAITGWSFEEAVPVVTNLKKIAASVKTPIPGVLQAGQWTYSPSGVPIAVLTAAFAADRIIKG